MSADGGLVLNRGEETSLLRYLTNFRMTIASREDVDPRGNSAPSSDPAKDALLVRSWDGRMLHSTKLETLLRLKPIAKDRSNAGI
ncbi:MULTISPECIES: hypothetical protein [unclassified Bradyrhizobium]|uniref:hypothetical protein n=1 Tax=unclassified Bradyrhizobium TaxID=2631580 RepID=UPI002479BCCC|nr:MULTISPECIES: hypothetical protein [unclassified Bradyrhizobium]WGR73294.1 hypothetical protein MTX24_10925 [Bradyrhizobium sp. ISRA426]WGR78131.1 hypothetical protein MTX21_35895 [Bradyrhizobium sp. ISRA430]WGR88532.1 hypothetical protein MTX25_10935 [Bradyrhizobium sp. ISRA432]